MTCLPGNSLRTAGGVGEPLPPLWKADSLCSDCLGLTRVGVFFGGGFLGLGCLPLGAALHGLFVGQLALPQVLLDLLLPLLLLAFGKKQRQQLFFSMR